MVARCLQLCLILAFIAGVAMRLCESQTTCEQYFGDEFYPERVALGALCIGTVGMAAAILAAVYASLTTKPDAVIRLVSTGLEHSGQNTVLV